MIECFIPAAPKDYNKYLVPTTDWKRLDNGWLPYLWQAANESNPTPFTMKVPRSVIMGKSVRKSPVSNGIFLF